jgi:hypothetical protein
MIMNLPKLKIIILLTLFSLAADLKAIEFAVFGDVTISESSNEDENTQIALGQLDFFATTNIDDKTRVFLEYVFENDGHGLIIDLERLWIAREISTGLTVAAGRFHTPLGHWNRTYHHGSFMQDSINRPFFLDFEDGLGGVLPVHIVGAMAWGTHYFSSGELNYEVFIANGSSIDTDEFGFNASADGKPEIEINDAGDVNQDKSIGLRLTFSPNEKMAGSLFVMSNDVAESGIGINSGVDIGGSLVEQTITGLDFKAEYGSFDTLIEYYRFDNDAQTVNQGSYKGDAFFTQFGWRYNPEFKALLRYENLDFDQQDSYFSLLGSEPATRQIVGIRYDLSTTNALKLELSHDKPKAGASNTGLAIQWTFIIP